MRCSELVCNHDAVNTRRYCRIQPSRRVFNNHRFSGSSAKAFEPSQIGFGMWFRLLVILPIQIEFHIVQDGPILVNESEVSSFGCGDYTHPIRICEFGQCLQDPLNLDVFSSKVFLIVNIADLTLPADCRFINTCRHGLGPGGESLDYVSKVLVSIQAKSDVSQGALSGFVIPEFGIHQNPIMVKEDVFLHRWSLLPSVQLHVIP